jgi:glycosyltransferase involved in cell wall biosynthesis/predicted O-methyltransferase YrrM
MSFKKDNSMNTLLCLSTSSFTVANDVVQSAWLEHGPFAFWLADQLRPRTFVELGAHNGYSYFCFCQAIDKLNIGATCYAVDTWQGDEHAGFYDESVYQSVVSKNERYRAFSQLLRMRFDEALQYFPDKSIDLLHIDGRHFYDDVKEDFESWLPKLSPCGIILFHDTQVRERNFGVWRLFEELSASYSTFNFVHGHGLGVLAVDKIPETLSSLFSASGEDVDIIRRSYARLGSAEYLRYRLADAERHQVAAVRQASELADQKIAVAAEQLQNALVAARRHEADAVKFANELVQMKAAEDLLREAEVQRHEADAAKAQRRSADLTTALAKARKLGDLPKLPRSLNVFGRLLHRSKRRRARDYRLLASSPLFDADWYRAKYPDVVQSGWDPILHYLVHGGKEWRQPSAAFDVEEYLAANPDVRASRHTPLVHFLRIGVFENRSLVWDHSAAAGGSELVGATDGSESVAAIDGSDSVSGSVDAEVDAIKKSGLFDEAFYRSMYTDLQLAPDDAIRHYCEKGWREGRNPSDSFDTCSYLKTYSDIRNAGTNPFWHYVIAGSKESRHANPDTATCFEDDIRFGRVETDIKLIAFYATPDWPELRSGRPVAKGQSQPLLPHPELAFYEPLDWQTLKRQSEMAKRHGLYGFCFQLDVHSDGEAPHRPVDLFLAQSDVSFRFCVQIKVASETFPESLITSLERAVSDQRFIRIRGRAVILVSVLSEAQRAAAALGDLKKRLADRGIINPFLICRFPSACVDYSGVSLADLCDALLDQPMPAPGETGSLFPVDKNGIDVAPYSVVASQGVIRARTAQGAAQPVFDCVTLGRDNTSKKPSRPLVYTGFNTKKYRRWIDAAIAGTKMSHPEDRRLLFVNGWNDWNEGLFLEPDRQNGFGRLNETSRALLGVATDARTPKVSVIVPNYNHERFLRRRLGSIYGQTYKNIEVILMDDASSDRSRFLLDEYAESYPDVTRTLYNDKNSGSPFRQWAKGIKAATGDLVWIAESDDFCDERFLEVLVRCFEDEAVLLAYSNCCFIDANENPTPGVFEHYVSDLECADKWKNSYVETAHNEVNTALGIKNTVPNASGAVFRRPAEMPLLDDASWLSMAVAGDWVFYLHIMRGGKIAYSKETTNFFRRYEGSAAEATYRKEIFFREVGIASRTVASLYNVPLTVLDQSRANYLTVYEYNVGRSEEEFALWYDYQSILEARETRLPNVMVSTMGFYPGGAEILPIRLANEYKRQGLSVLLLNAGLNPHEDGVRRMLRNDVPVVETADIDDVKSIIHNFGIEVLNTHQWHVQKYPLHNKDVFHELRAHVASLHGMIEHGDAFATTEAQLRIADQNVTTWVYTADKNLGPFRTFGLYDKSSPRFVKLPNGMTQPNVVPIPRADMGIPEDAFTFCCVSRAIPDKGWAETILVVERARALSGRDIRLILVGNGPVYDEYCKAGVPDFVYLAGFSEDSVGHYAAADMGIMLTKFKFESFPLTIVDCLFAGRPYIASDVGDIRNMLTTKDGPAGEVIELVDWEVQIEKAAQVVAAFATDRKKYAHSLSLVQALVKRYRIDAVASQYVRIFQSDMMGTEAKKEFGRLELPFSASESHPAEMA